MVVIMAITTLAPLTEPTMTMNAVHTHHHLIMNEVDHLLDDTQVIDMEEVIIKNIIQIIIAVVVMIAVAIMIVTGMEMIDMVVVLIIIIIIQEILEEAIMNLEETETQEEVDITLATVAAVVVLSEENLLSKTRSW
jgi:hypothetical protein